MFSNPTPDLRRDAFFVCQDRANGGGFGMSSLGNNLPFCLLLNFTGTGGNTHWHTLQGIVEGLAKRALHHLETIRHA